MKNANERFEFYLAQFEQQLAQAFKEENPGLWLYNNKARTTLFMLEALAKLYGIVYKNKTLSKIKEQFKLLEDTLGQVDYYDCFAKEFENNPDIPEAVKQFLQVRTAKNLLLLNELLTGKNWIGKKSTRVNKIRNRISGIEWMKPKEEINAIEKFYKRGIKINKEFFESIVGDFTDLEEHVHSLRRKLRWLSIYAQAMQGAIQLTDNSKEDPATDKYLTPEITGSPFNKLPDAGDNFYFLLLEKKYFLALSWIITELGKLKDKGHKIVAVTDAIRKTEGISHDAARTKALQLLGLQEGSIQNILEEASAISKQFFAEKNLDKLVSGISYIEK